MTTIQQLVETMDTTIDEANDDIEQLRQCNECMTDRIERNQHLIDWNKGVISHRFSPRKPQPFRAGRNWRPKDLSR